MRRIGADSHKTILRRALEARAVANAMAACLIVAADVDDATAETILYAQRPSPHLRLQKIAIYLTAVELRNSGPMVAHAFGCSASKIKRALSAVEDLRDDPETDDWISGMARRLCPVEGGRPRETFTTGRSHP